MKLNTARKIGVSFYTAGVILLLIRLVIPLSGLWNKVMYYGFFACLLVGFVICYSFCRCPHCNRVLRAGFRTITKCPYCENEIKEDSRG